MTASMKTHSCQRMAGMSCNVVEIKSAAKRMACAAITMVRVPSPTIHPQRHSLGPVSPLQGISTDFFSFDKISITAIAAKKQTQMIFVCRNVVATIATYAKYKLRLGPCVISGKLLQHAYQTGEPIALFFHEHVCQKDKKSWSRIRIVQIVEEVQYGEPDKCKGIELTFSFIARRMQNRQYTTQDGV